MAIPCGSLLPSCPVEALDRRQRLAAGLTTKNLTGRCPDVQFQRARGKLIWCFVMAKIANFASFNRVNTCCLWARTKPNWQLPQLLLERPFSYIAPQYCSCGHGHTMIAWQVMKRRRDEAQAAANLWFHHSTWTTPCSTLGPFQFRHGIKRRRARGGHPARGIGKARERAQQATSVFHLSTAYASFPNARHSLQDICHKAASETNFWDDFAMGMQHTQRQNNPKP